METPTPDSLKRLLGRYARASLSTDVRRLSLDDRRTLATLAKCGPLIDNIYWKQRSETGEAIRNNLVKLQGVHSKELQRFLDLNFGPWDNLNHDEPFVGSERRPLGGSFYPRDLSRDEFLHYLASENNKVKV